MRILFTTYQKGFAGSAYSLTYLIKGLYTRGHQVWLAAPEDSIISESLRGVVPITYLNKGFKYFDKQSINVLAQLINKEDIEFVSVQSSRDRYVSIALKLFYTPKVEIVHTRRQRANSKGLFLQNLLYNLTARKMIAVSEGVKESMLKLGLKKDKIVVIHNGTPKEKYDNLNTKKVEQLRSEYDINPGDVVVGCVARKKRQVQLLKALEHLPRHYIVIFVGLEEVDLAKEIEETTPQQKLVFTGKLDSNEVLHHYLLFDVKVLPSVIEGFSQAILEAMALEVPVVATNACGNPDLIEEGVTGLLFQDDDIEELSEKIKKVVNMSQEDRQIITQKAKAIALQEHEINNVIEKYEALFQEIIAEKELGK